MVVRLLHLQFGSLETEIEERARSADADRLLKRGERVLTAESPRTSSEADPACRACRQATLPDCEWPRKNKGWSRPAASGRLPKARSGHSVSPDQILYPVRSTGQFSPHCETTRKDRAGAGYCLHRDRVEYSRKGGHG